MAVHVLLLFSPTSCSVRTNALHRRKRYVFRARRITVEVSASILFEDPRGRCRVFVGGDLCAGRLRLVMVPSPATHVGGGRLECHTLFPLAYTISLEER